MMRSGPCFVASGVENTNPLKDAEIIAKNTICFIGYF
jgi:hypothetical protein